jgi:hypothetical protein
MENIRDLIAEADTDILFLSEVVYDAALIGIAQHPHGQSALYDGEKVLDILMAGGMDRTDAIDYFEFNIAGAFVGDAGPSYFWKVQP